MIDGFQPPEAGDKLSETVKLTSLKGLKLWGDLSSAEIACSWRARKGGAAVPPKFLLFFATIHAIKETKSEPWGPSWWSSAGERLAMQGTQAQSLIGDLGSHNHGTTRPMHHIY